MFTGETRLEKGRKSNRMKQTIRSIAGGERSKIKNEQIK